MNSITRNKINYCEEEQKNSLKCLLENQRDPNLCQDFFKKFKECKSLWLKQNGIFKTK